MKTFEDLEFKQHIPNCIQATLELKPNIFLSVVAGEGFYSTSKDGVRAACNEVEDASTFEVAIIDESTPDEEKKWDVRGWQTREDINKILSNY